MAPTVEIVASWPEPDTVEPAVVLAGSSLAICYGTGVGLFAVVTFSDWYNVKSGGPNDEALHGHPLYDLGLEHYSIHRIGQSAWLSELERQNSVHSLHSRERFLEGKAHYLFALKEEVVECIVSESEPVLVEVFQSRAAALRHAMGAIEA
jgi:hypothetical protein